MQCARPSEGEEEKRRRRLVETNGLAHRRLDVKRLDVLPVLLEERDQEVDGCRTNVSRLTMIEVVVRRTQHDVTKDLVVIHVNVANSNTQAKDLLELELDGGTDLSDLVVQVLSVRDWGRELASCGMNE